MTVVSHLRFLKVHRAGIASLFGSYLAFCSNKAHPPKGTNDPGAPLGFGFNSRKIPLSLAAFSGLYLTMRKAAGTSAHTGVTPSPTDSVLEGGVA
jgi:hypothetical protein